MVVVDAMSLMAPPDTKAGFESAISLFFDNDTSGQWFLARWKKHGLGENAGVDDAVEFFAVGSLSRLKTMCLGEGLEVSIAARPVGLKVRLHGRRLGRRGSSRACGRIGP